MKKNIWKNNGIQSLLASLACVVLGMLLGVPVCSVVYVLVQDYIRSGKPARTDGVPPTQS